MEILSSGGTPTLSTSGLATEAKQDEVIALLEANSAGSHVSVTNLDTTADSQTAPAGAVGFILHAINTNTEYLRWCIGATATATVGLQLEPGRDTGYVPCAATISIIAEAGTGQGYQIQWILKA